MARKSDYSKYEMSSYEKEIYRHRGNESILFTAFNNKVVELKEEKSIYICVDDFFENDNMADIFAEDEGFNSREEYLEKYYKDLLEGVPDYFEMELEDIVKHKEIIEKYSKKFDIISPYYGKEQKEALTTALAGARIKLSLGEGLLDFCYADFNTAFDNSKDFYSIFSDEMIDQIKTKNNLPIKDKVSEIKNKNQEIIEEYYHYSDAVSVLDAAMNTSLYSLIFPPKLINQNNRAFERYSNYILNLQEEILSLIEFCYDEKYYPTLLQNLTASERFNIYTRVSDTHLLFNRTEVYQTGSLITASAVPIVKLSNRSVSEHLAGINDESATEFAQKYGLDTDFAKMMVALPTYNSVYYKCSTIFDMLMLEFTKMLEYDVRFRKCKNCGKYFIMKGNYQTDFCDRIPEGQTKSCQTLGAVKNYKDKVKTSGAWSLYNKYYKRYFARMKANNIDVDVFKKWQYAATAMRDDCVDGKVSESEFEVFLHGSFVNRKLK